MKKIILLLVFVITALSLFSCIFKWFDNAGNSEENGLADPNAIYGKGIKTYIIVDNDEEWNSDDLNSLQNLIYNKSGSHPFVLADNHEENQHEIVLGNSNRAITTAAYNKLDLEIKKAGSAGVYS